MHRRGILFTTSLLFVAMLTTIPTLGILAFLGWIIISGGNLPFGFAGITPTYCFSELQSASLVNDRYQSAYFYDDYRRIYLNSIDPENGVFDRSEAERSYVVVALTKIVSPISGFNLRVIGDADRLWVIDDRSRRIFEREDERFVERSLWPVSVPTPIGVWRRSVWNGNEHAFVWNGRLSDLVETMPGRRELHQLIDGNWQSQGEIPLLNTEYDWWTADGDVIVPALPDPVTRSNPLSATGTGTQSERGLKRSLVGSIEVLAIGDTVHLFWRLPDRLLYRQGIDLTSVDSSQLEADSQKSSADVPASALTPENADGVAEGWLLVADNLTQDTSWYRVVVDGKPAVILIHDPTTLSPMANALRMEEGRWTEFASTELPFRAFALEAGSREDGSMAYLSTGTPLGRSRVLAIQPTGFRLTQLDQTNALSGLDGYIMIAVYLVWSLLMGLVLATLATILMCRDGARYEFGSQTVSLASVWERGTARTVDMILILLGAAGVFYQMNQTLRPDWGTFLEAILPSDKGERPFLHHPSVAAPSQIFSAILGCLIGLTLLFIVLQGRYGFTPGKWICGLRLKRTTLRPSGFSRSLLRELSMCVDCFNLACWTPGILSIAFTSHRQRIGDIVSDTIVIRRRSLGPDPVPPFSSSALDH